MFEAVAVSQMHMGSYPFQVADLSWWTSASCVMEAGLGRDQQQLKVEQPFLA